jgi:hypothetical protein
MEKIQIFEDLINRIQIEEHKYYVMFGDKISVTNGKTTEHSIMFHIDDRKDRLYYNGNLREIRTITPIIIPVIKYEKGFSKKMAEANHEHRLTGCELIMVSGKKPRLMKMTSGNGAYYHDEIDYEIINREEFFKNINDTQTIENMFGNKIKELNKIYN